ncbi:hypothetical protein RRG08_007463 [Elysia crispata]|uniref:Uncharacterized protein n=1 Tax=Elysia crispata TaxID=231223 RepID=A0AAE0XN46_9GAST|nr:hypothetical protein RRG08_007463 [Elysia crispata]
MEKCITIVLDLFPREMRVIITGVRGINISGQANLAEGRAYRVTDRATKQNMSPAQGALDLGRAELCHARSLEST